MIDLEEPVEPVITRDARHRGWGIDEALIRAQIKEATEMPGWRFPQGIIPLARPVTNIQTNTVDPRAQMNLDGTKIARDEHRERVQAYMAGEKVAPITIDMALTQKCSLKCTYCYAGLQQNTATPSFWSTYKQLIDDFVSIGHRPGQGVRGVSLVSDGESTESPYFHDFIMYGKSRGIDMASGTNGLLLEPARFPELLPALTYLRINLSVGEKAKYGPVMGGNDRLWDKLMDIIGEAVRVNNAHKQENVFREQKRTELLRERGYDRATADAGLVAQLEKEMPASLQPIPITTIGTQMVLLPEYADQVLPLTHLSKKLGVDYLVIKHCSDDEMGSLGVDYNWYHTPLAQDLLIAAEGLSDSQTSIQAKWSKLKTGRDRNYDRCFGPALMLQISGSGIVAPCGSFFGKGYERYQIGNFHTTPFRELWASERYWEVLHHLHGGKFNPQHMCETLCLQHKVNESLFKWMDQGQPLPDTRGSSAIPHINFV